MEVMEQVFTERLQEIETYLDFLQTIEDQVRGGPPRVGAAGVVISTTQQRILYSSVIYSSTTWSKPRSRNVSKLFQPLLQKEAVGVLRI